MGYYQTLNSGEMLIQSYPTAETWQMDLKSDTSTAFGCEAAVAMKDTMLQANGQCSLTHIQSHSQVSGVSITSECSAPHFVYQRRRLLKSPAPLPLTRVPANTSSDMINIVYERRKHQRSNATSFSTIFSAHTSPSRACTSAAAVEKTGGSHDIEASRLSSMSDVKDKMNKTIELHSVDDSCSSSMLDMDIGSVPMETEIDDTDECSSSGELVAHVMGDNLSLSTNDLCISILRSHGLLSGFVPNRYDASEEESPSCSGSSCSRSCNVCGFSGITEDMLICDECEEAFHVSCCNPSIRNMPVDEWYCQSCFKMKHKMIKERAIRMSSIIRSEKGSATCEGDLSPITLMLKDTEPYTTGVRVGKGFQAIVPEWSGPVIEETDVIPEPMELDQSDSVILPGLVSGNPRRSNFIGNWLQCREVIVGVGEEGIDGTVCGKWRRAPLFLVQTDNWDCFSSVLWDPTHADCAVPQELETEEVLKQLKYIEILRPKLVAKRRKLETCKADGSPVRTENASNCTDSMNAARDL